MVAHLGVTVNVVSKGENSFTVLINSLAAAEL